MGARANLSLLLTPSDCMPRRANTKKKLRPEQTAALQKFKEVFLSGSVPIMDEFPTFEELGRKDAVVVIRHPFVPGSLPTREPWIWNQSRGRAKQLILGRYQVEFYKLRLEVHRRSNQRHAPRRKLWVFLCNDLEDDCQSTMLWCQEGHEDEYVAPTEKLTRVRDHEFTLRMHSEDTSSPEESVDDSPEVASPLCEDDLGISVEQFAFLRPFVEESCAREFGWL